MAAHARPGEARPGAGVRPLRWERPVDVVGVCVAVETAARDGLAVRPAGAGSSVSGLTATEGVQLDLTRLDQVRSVDSRTRVAVVEAGIRLSRLWPLLWTHGLAMDALGGLDDQTLGGAIAIGEHGSGLRFGSLSSRVLALEMVLADGSVVTCSADEQPELFQAARVGLGAFGVVTAVTLACGPAREVELTTEDLPRETFLDQVDELVEAHDHVEFRWSPDTDEVRCTTADGRADAGPPTPPSGVPRRRPSSRRGGLPGPRALAGRGYRILARRAGSAERESEFAVPRACFPVVFEELRERMGDRSVRSGIAGALRVRFGAAEDAWLAMGQGRETAYLAASATRGPAVESFFAILESVAARYDGRPHWGRVHGLQAATLRPRYPRFDDANAVRDRVDPHRLFGSLQLDRILGT